MELHLDCGVLEDEGRWLYQDGIVGAEIPDEQVEALAAATDALAGLVALLQQRPVR